MRPRFTFTRVPSGISGIEIAKPTATLSCRRPSRPSIEIAVAPDAACDTARLKLARPGGCGNGRRQSTLPDEFPLGALCAVVAYEYFRLSADGATLFDVIPPMFVAALPSGLIGYALPLWRSRRQPARSGRTTSLGPSETSTSAK